MIISRSFSSARSATVLIGILLPVLAGISGCRIAPEPSVTPTAEPPPAVESAAQPQPVALIDIPDRSTWSVTASAIQEEGYEGPLACDGKTDTRWSSPSADPQWLQIDLGKPATLCCLSILWETAYANE